MEEILFIIGCAALVVILWFVIEDGFIKLFSYLFDFALMALLGLVVGAIAHLILPSGISYCIWGVICGLVYELYCIIFKRGVNPILMRILIRY